MLVIALGIGFLGYQAMAANCSEHYSKTIEALPFTVISRPILSTGDLSSGKIVLINLESDTGLQVVLQWTKERRGFLELWNLQLVSNNRTLLAPYMDSPEGELNICNLTSIWPKANHQYEIMLALAQETGDISLQVVDMTDCSEIYGATMRSAVPFETLTDGEWHVSSLGDDLEMHDVYNRAGVPHELAKDFQWAMVYTDKSGHVLRETTKTEFTVDENVAVRILLPESRQKGKVHVVFATDDGKVHPVASVPWDLHEMVIRLPLVQMPPGAGSLNIDYVDGDYRTSIATYPMVLAESRLNIEFVGTYIPLAWSVSSSNVRWGHSRSVGNTVQAHIVLTSSNAVSEAELWIEASSSPSPDTIEKYIVHKETISFSAGERKIIPFAFEPPAGVDRLEIQPIFPNNVFLVETKPFVLHRAPVEWALPWPIRNLPAAGYPLLDDVVHYDIYQGEPSLGTFNHVPELLYHEGVFYLAWNNHPTDEDAPGQRILGAISFDGEHWTEPIELFPPFGTEARSGVLPRGRLLTVLPFRFRRSWVNIDGDVYVIATVIDGGGYQGYLGEVARQVYPDGTLGPIFWLAEKSPQDTPHSNPIEGFPQFPDLQDPQFRQIGLKIIEVNSAPWGASEYPERNYMSYYAEDGARLIELCQFTRADGTNVVLARHAGLESSGHIYAGTYQEDNSELVFVRTSVPDDPSLVFVDVLPDGTTFMIGNQVRGTRDPLVISLSSDGISFNRAGAVRHGASQMRYQGKFKLGGFQYPCAVLVEDVLWVAYSINKESIAITRIGLDSLARLTIPQ